MIELSKIGYRNVIELSKRDMSYRNVIELSKGDRFIEP